jgi:hypothetical protein
MEEFKRFAKMLVEKARSLEASRTLRYEFHLPTLGEPTICLVHEAFVDAQAFLDHIVNFQADVNGAAELFCVERSELWGDLPRDFLEQMRGGSGAAQTAWFGTQCAAL